MPTTSTTSIACMQNRSNMKEAKQTSKFKIVDDRSRGGYRRGYKLFLVPSKQQAILDRARRRSAPQRPLDAATRAKLRATLAQGLLLNPQLRLAQGGRKLGVGKARGNEAEHQLTPPSLVVEYLRGKPGRRGEYVMQGHWNKPVIFSPTAARPKQFSPGSISWKPVKTL